MQTKQHVLRGIKGVFMQIVDTESINDRDSMKDYIKQLFMADLTDLRNKNRSDDYLKAIYGSASKPEDIKPDIHFSIGLYEVEQTIKDCLTFTNDDVKSQDKSRHDNFRILEIEKEYSELFNNGKSLKANLLKHLEGDAGRFINNMLQLFDKMTEEHKNAHKNPISPSGIPNDYTGYHNLKWQNLHLTLDIHKKGLEESGKAALQDLYNTMGKLIDKSSEIMALQLRIFEEEKTLSKQYNEALTKIINECYQEVTQEFQIKVFHEVQAIKQAEKNRAKERQAAENKQMLENNIRNSLKSSIMKIMQDAKEKNRTKKMQETNDRILLCISMLKMPNILNSTIKDDIISRMLNDDENHTEDLQDDYRNKIKNALKLELGGDDNASDIFLDDFMKSWQMKQALDTFYTTTVLPAVLGQADQNVNVTENAVNQYNETQNVLYNLFCKFIFRIFGFPTLDNDLTKLNAEHTSALTFRDKVNNQTKDQYIQRHFNI